MTNSNSIAKDFFEVFDKVSDLVDPDNYLEFNDATIPNPGLSIEGVGQLRLPFCPQDGEAIMNRFKTPQGQPCEIDPWSVSFENSGWKAYVDETLLARICTMAGLSESTIKMSSLVFKKVVLYGPDECGTRKSEDDGEDHEQVSRSSPLLSVTVANSFRSCRHCTDARLSTYRRANTHLHVEVTLPSCFEGGCVNLTHEILEEQWGLNDGSYRSDFTTSIMAWWPGFKCAVGPVRSGYRLSLEYTIEIDDLPSIQHLIPSLTQWDHLVEKMKRVILQWKTGAYHGRVPSPPVIAIPGDAVNSKFISILHSLAAGDYELYLFKARVNLSITSNDNAPQGACVESKRVEVTELKCLMNPDRPTADSMLNGKSFQISEASLTPGFFDGTIPQTTYRNGTEDWRNPSQAEQSYYRDGHVLFLSTDESQLSVLANGVEWAVDELQGLMSKPTGDNQELLTAVLKQFVAAREHVRQNGEPFGDDISGPAEGLLECATEWEDFDLWRKVLPFCDFAGKDLVDAVTGAMDLFRVHFKDIQRVIERLAEGMSSPIERLEMLKALREGVQSVPRSWATAFAMKQFVQYSYPDETDIPTIIKTGKRIGFDNLQMAFNLHLSRREYNFDFLVAFVKALGRLESDDRYRASELARACLLAAAAQWKVPEGQPSTTLDPFWISQPGAAYPRSANVERICSMIMLSLSCERLSAQLNVVLDTVLPSEDGNTVQLEQEFRDIYIPLVPSLKDTLEDYDLAVSSPPFNTFLHNLLRIFLDRVFEWGGCVPVLGIPSVLCSPSCNDCRQLNSFLQSSDETVVLMMRDQNHRHLQEQIDSYGTVTRLVTLGPSLGHTFKIFRKKRAIGWDAWKSRQAVARSFLGSIGGPDVLLAIMGKEMFVAACRALEPLPELI